MMTTQTPKLTIELVPKTAWFSNVRSHVTATTWKKISTHFSSLSLQRCAICGGAGRAHPVECHEVWHYNDVRHVQTLVNMTALCPSCHQVKHIGLAQVRGRGPQATQHLMKVNQWPMPIAQSYINNVFELWHQRSKFNWDIDLKYLETLPFPVEIITQRLAFINPEN